MAKPLSQEEINELLQEELIDEEGENDVLALKEWRNAIENRQVEPYNFKRPRLFTQERMRHLRRVHEAFARDLAVYLSAQLRTYVDIKVDAIDQDLYSEFAMASVHPSVLYIYDSNVNDNQIVFEVDPRLVLFMVEKLCGGNGTFPEKRRKISQIEERIMSKVMNRANEELTTAWEQNKVDLTMNRAGFETNAEFVQILPANDPAMVVTLVVRMMNEESIMSICYPYLLLETILNQNNFGGRSERKDLPPPGKRGNHEKALQSSLLELRAELGRTTLRGTDILSLDKGDVIPLGQRVDRPVNVIVDDKVRFTGNPGQSSGKRSIQIVDVLLD